MRVCAPGREQSYCADWIVVLRFGPSKPITVLGTTEQPHISGGYEFLVLDYFDAAPFSNAYELAVHGCLYRDLLDQRIIAAAKFAAPGATSSDVLWAKLFDTESGLWEDLPASDVRCHHDRNWLHDT
jgi:hypothetical protein